MGRPAQISHEDLIAAAALVAARLGPAKTSIAAVSKAAGVPTGSIYHRLPSRDALLAEIWLTAAERFQTMALAAFAAASERASMAAACVAFGTARPMKAATTVSARMKRAVVALLDMDFPPDVRLVFPARSGRHVLD